MLLKTVVEDLKVVVKVEHEQKNQRNRNENADLHGKKEMRTLCLVYHEEQ